MGIDNKNSDYLGVMLFHKTQLFETVTLMRKLKPHIPPKNPSGLRNKGNKQSLHRQNIYLITFVP